MNDKAHIIVAALLAIILLLSILFIASSIKSNYDFKYEYNGDVCRYYDDPWFGDTVLKQCDSGSVYYNPVGVKFTETRLNKNEVQQ